MNRTMATWLSLITALVIAALAIAVVGLVFGAKASDEKADDTSVTQQLDELRGTVDAEIEDLRSAIDQVAGAVDGLAAEEASQIDVVGQIGAAVNELDARLTDAEELLSGDEQ